MIIKSQSKAINASTTTTTAVTANATDTQTPTLDSVKLNSSSTPLSGKPVIADGEAPRPKGKGPAWLGKVGLAATIGAAFAAVPAFANAQGITATAASAAAPAATATAAAAACAPVAGHAAAAASSGIDIGTVIGIAGLGIGGVMLYNMFKNQKAMGAGGGNGLGVKNGSVHRVVVTEKRMKDVAGIPGAMAEINEIIDFIKNPGKYEKMGAKIPRGVLMDGEPGTGKSHLAECIAGEAGVPMLSINGSDFDEKLVGVGASRVRSLFEEAAKAASAEAPDAEERKQKAMEAAKHLGKEAAKAAVEAASQTGACIIFVDEIDSFGKKRSSDGNSSGGSEQTLNAFLTEMSGVGAAKGIVVIAATNRPDMLDPALTRSGRFDRKINVPRPNMEGRLAILGVHSRKVPLENAKDLEHIAARSTGLVGADMANIVNEAAISAVRDGVDKVTLKHLSQAMDKVVMGAHRVGTVLSDKEKLETARHEAGHGLISKLLPSNGDVQKMSILPRGRALGVCWTTPAEEKVSKHISEIEDSICMLLGGRAAEEVTFGTNVSTGASNDIERATKMAKDMVCTYGMSPLGLAQISDGRGPGLTPSDSDTKAINAKVNEILQKQYDRAKDLLTAHQPTYDALSNALFAKEELDRPQLDEIFAGLQPNKTAA